MKKYADLNSHHIGMVMRECVRRAMYEINSQRLIFTSKVKFSDYKTENDLITSADIKAQEIYLKIINENFPKAGIIAEENFSRKCTAENCNYYFTIDPLDGTKAYGRGQSHGVSTMISFVYNDVVEGITIGDPNTKEVFHCRPGSQKVYRIYDFEKSVELKINEDLPLSFQYLQLRTDPRNVSGVVQKMSDPKSNQKTFKGIEVSGGSIGITFTRLWKSEVGAVLIDSSQLSQTPWDSAPVYGLSKKMGFIFFRIDSKGKYEEWNYVPKEENFKINGELLIIHKSKAREFCESVGILTA